ncbi:MAG: substrate-binding domain-containing protein [Anaerolineae bacterium]
MSATLSLLGYLAALTGGSLCTVMASPGPSGARVSDAGAGASSPASSGAGDAPAAYTGVRFSVPGVADLPDLHGNPADAGLVLYVGGNYFFALPPLLHAFTAGYPSLSGRVFYETLPPGVLRRQMESRNTITVGNLTVVAAPDVFQAGEQQLADMVAAGLLEEPIVPFARTGLAIMVPVGNPGRVESLSDLARPGLRLAMPNPETEGIAVVARDALRRAGGVALEREVYEVKVQRGEVILTEVHHRQTPALLVSGEAQAGLTWSTEINYQESSGAPISGVPVAHEFSGSVTFAAAMVRGAAHRQAAEDWLRFLGSAEAQQILDGFGFERIEAAEPAQSDRAAAPTLAKANTTGEQRYFATVADDVELSRPPEGAVKIVYHYDYLDPLRFAASLNSIGRLLQSYGESGRPVRVALVFHHHGINFLMKDYRRGSMRQPYAARDGFTKHAFFEAELRRLADRGAAIRVCRNTMQSLGLGRDDLWPFAEQVAAGVMWVAELQSDYGYAYVKADE